MASGKTQGTGCALVSNLKAPEVLLSFHQANMRWPDLCSRGCQEARAGEQPRELSLDSQAHLELSAGLVCGPCFHGRVTAAHPVVGFNSSLLTLFLVQAKPGFAFPCVVHLASQARCKVGCERRCRPAQAPASPGLISIWGALWRC